METNKAVRVEITRATEVRNNQTVPVIIRETEARVTIRATEVREIIRVTEVRVVTDLISRVEINL